MIGFSPLGISEKEYESKCAYDMFFHFFIFSVGKGEGVPECIILEFK